jgi:hypothetical protein
MQRDDAVIRSVRVFAVFLCLLALLASSRTAATREDEEKGRIAGKVTDDHGVSVHEAFVIVKGMNVGGVTDSTGTFALRNVPVGSFTLRAVRIGFNRSEVEGVQVRADQTTNVDFVLTRKPTPGPDGDNRRNRWPYVSAFGMAACSDPVGIPTSGWKRTRLLSEPVSFLLPETFVRDSMVRFEHGGILWIDGDRKLEQVNGLWGAHSFGEPGTSPGYSECVDTIAGVPYRIVTAYWPSYPAYAAVAVPMDPGDRMRRFSSYREVLIGKGPDSSDRALFLTIFSTLRPDSILKGSGDARK